MINLARESFRWFAYGDERAQVQQLRGEVVDAGVRIVRTRSRADTLQREIEAEDRGLTERLKAVRRYDRFARGGALPAHLYTAYRRDLRDYNVLVAHRNARVREWKELMRSNREAVERYNLLADSIRAIATRIGDPFYPVPLPAEAATERGLANPVEAVAPAGQEQTRTLRDARGARSFTDLRSEDSIHGGFVRFS